MKRILFCLLFLASQVSQAQVLEIAGVRATNSDHPHFFTIPASTFDRDLFGQQVMGMWNPQGDVPLYMVRVLVLDSLNSRTGQIRLRVLWPSR